MFKIFKPHKRNDKSLLIPSSMPHRTSPINFQNGSQNQDHIERYSMSKLKLDNKRQLYSTSRSVNRPNNQMINTDNLKQFLTKRNQNAKRIYTSQKSLRQKETQNIPQINFLESALQYFGKNKSKFKKQSKQKLSFQIGSKTSKDWHNLSSRSDIQTSKILTKQKIINNNIDLFSQKSKRRKIDLACEKESKLKNEFCTIILLMEKFQTQICYKVRKIQSLIEFLKNYIQKENIKRSIQNDNLIVSFETIDFNLQLDYYLTLKDQDGSFLNGQTIALRPVYEQKQQNINLNSFEILQTIGAGGFSTVYLARFKQNGKFYAMKVIDKQFIVKNNKKKIVMNERNVMIGLNNHPFLAKLYYAFQSKSHLVFIMEYYEGGELFNILKRFRKMSEDMAKFYITETLLGLEEIHKKGIAYRDFKPENIMLNISGHVCIADFGLAKPNIKSSDDRAYSFCGSPQYMPPQMIMKEGHSLPVDFYCLGALLYELVTGLPPFYDADSEKIYESTLSEQVYFPEHAMNLSDQLKDLLYRLLCKEQRFRIGTKYGVKEVLSHPWFGKIHKQEYLQKKVKPPVSFKKIQQLKFNIDEMKAENQKMIKSMLKSQKIQQQAKYLKVMNGFYYDCRIDDHLNCDSIENAKRTSIKSSLSSKIKNNSSSLALTSCTKRSEENIEIEFMKKQKELMYSKNAELNKRSSEQLKRKQNIRMTDRKLFKNLNNYI